MVYIVFWLSGILAFIDTVRILKKDAKMHLMRLVILISIFYLSFGFMIGIQSNVQKERIVNRTFSVVCVEDQYIYFVKNSNGDLVKKTINPDKLEICETDTKYEYAIEYIVKPHLSIGEELTKILFLDEKLLPVCIKKIEYDICVPKGTIFKET